MKVFLILLGLIVLLPFSAIWSGYVLSVLWGWFAVTAFNLPALSVPTAIGITTIIRFVTYVIPREDDRDSTTKAVEGVVYAALFPAVFLGYGWVAYQFV
ncbi:MAG: hypothetical protein GQ474_07920 [Sulfurimonas sp.]|nr:hypothetical protein [Sulfurimonas sp.]